MDAPTRDLVAVDIIMRTRDRTLLLGRAVDDVLSQASESWMLTIINDGGDPEPVDHVVTSRAHLLRERIRVVHNEQSLGMEAATNQALALGTAPFVAIHDDDDTWHRDFLSVTTRWLDENLDATAVAVRTEIVWEAITDGEVRELSREIFLPELEQVTLAQLLRFNTSVPISMLYRRASLDAVGGFDASLRVVGDWECNLRLATAGRIGFLPDRPLAFWHQRPNAEGALSNSVIGQREDHRRADRLVRDRELRAAVARDGVGLPLYLTKYLDERFEEMERRFDVLERRGIGGFVRRARGYVRRHLWQGRKK